MDREITLERFAAIVDAYGASPMRWPVDERGAAEALLAVSAEARALLADARMLDGMLASAPVEAPSGALVERLMAARPRVAAAPVAAKPQGFFRELIAAIWPYGSPALPTGALAASIVLGVALGSVSEIAVLDATSSAVTASDETETGDRLIALALADITWPEEWMQ